jgi:hypothetical protein
LQHAPFLLLLSALHTILSDPRVRSVPWRDLTHLGRDEITRARLLSLPWLALSLVCAARERYVAALALSFVFFLTGLRQVHGAHHYTLGLPRWATEWVMFALSVLMLGSMHAIQVNRLRHHQHLMSDDDVEAMSARLQWWQALLIGPAFPVLLHVTAPKVGNARQRPWIAAELSANLAALCIVWLIAGVAFLKYHVIAMAVGQCLTAFFGSGPCIATAIGITASRARFEAARRAS